MNLERLLSSLVHFEIVKFFADNPRIVDTPAGVATFTGIDVSTTRRALEELAKVKILVVHRTPSTVGYSFTTDKTMLKKITSLLKRRAKEFPL